MPRIVSILAVTVVAGVTSASAPGQTDTLSVLWVAPVDDGKVAVERIAARHGKVSETWRLNMDVAIRNNGSSSASLTRIEVGYPDAPVTIASATYVPGFRTIPAGGAAVIQLPENRELPFPVPPAIKATIWFGSKAVIVRKSLMEFSSGVAGGAYLFPGSRTDLRDGWYWTDNQSHTLGSKHRASATQRLAYDFGVRRWSGKVWTTLHPGKSGSRNEHFLIWEMPVYAMADGWILRCLRTIDDQKPGDDSGTGSGNGYRIVHATGEVALYAHMRDDSVPVERCPTEGVNATEPRAKRVKAGDFLGLVGNTGSSSGPHLHVHIDTTGLTGKESGQGLPLEFKDIRTLYVGHDWKQMPACSPENLPFATTKRAGIGYRMLVEPLYRRDASELTRHAVTEDCLQGVVENASAAGYKPFWIDGYEVDGKAWMNAVFRPGAGQWVMRHALSASSYQSEISNWTSRGFRPTLVESYRKRDSLRYAFVGERRSGSAFGAYHGRSAGEHRALANDFKRRGFSPRSVAVVSLKGKLYYTALWEMGISGGWTLSSTLTSSEYQSWLQTSAATGKHLVYVNAYHHNGSAQFSGIVRSGVSTSYAARHELTPAAYQTEFSKWTLRGLRTQVVSGYKSGSSHRFAALWR